MGQIEILNGGNGSASAESIRSDDALSYPACIVLEVDVVLKVADRYALVRRDHASIGRRALLLQHSERGFKVLATRVPPICAFEHSCEERDVP